MTYDKDPVLIQHILDAIEAINTFIQDTDIIHFVEDDKTSSAVMKKFEIIGEASNYIGADLEGVWNTIHEDLPALKSELGLVPEAKQVLT